MVFSWDQLRIIGRKWHRLAAQNALVTLNEKAAEAKNNSDDGEKKIIKKKKKKGMAANLPFKR